MQYNLGIHGVNPEQKTKILDYLNGSADAEQIGITRENGYEYLTAIKKIDLEIAKFIKTNGWGLNFARTTYGLRSHVLRVCSPGMQTAEAYTKETDAAKITDYRYLKNSEGWIAERVGIHAKLIANQYALVVALSKRLKQDECEVSAIRGGTGVGKSHHLSKQFSYALDSDNELSGCLSPDAIKAAIKQQAVSNDGIRLVNTQVYAEATALFAIFQQAVSGQALRLRIITDTRLISMDYFESSVIEPAKLRKGSASLFDVDATLEASILRVLTRDPYGKDPCVPLQAIIDGFVEIRANRGVFIDRIKADATIKTYKLYCIDEKGRKILAAKKNNNAFVILNQQLVKKSIVKPAKQDIQNTIKKKLTPEFIDKAIAAKIISLDKRQFLERWKGKTLAHAMARHVRGVVTSTSEQVFLPETLVTLRQLKNRYAYGGKSIPGIDDRHFCPLFLAAKKGDMTALETFLDQKEDVNEIECNEGSLQDAMTIAAIMGHAHAVDLLLIRGVNPFSPISFSTFKNAEEERLTPLGHAIENRHLSVVETLFNHGVPIDQIYREKEGKGTPLNLFFAKHKTLGPSPLLLKFLLSAGASLHDLSPETMFCIGVYANSEELEILLNAGLDPSTMELALMAAERANLFGYDPDSIRKVKLLLEQGKLPNPQTSFDQNYLYLTTPPDIIKLFWEHGFNPSANAIEMAADEETIEFLCSIGQDREKSPYVKGTVVHDQALERIGFKHGNLDKNGDVLLIRAVKNWDLSAFLALLGEGVDVNHPSKDGWTCLHYLFSVLSSGSLSRALSSPINDYIRLAKDIRTRLIHLLIKHGAKPLKDKLNRTPLACLDFDSSHRFYNEEIIDAYSAFEANHYKVDRHEYHKKLLRLREDGLCFNGLEVLPAPGTVNEFWKSIENHTEFNPPRRFNPPLDTIIEKP